MVIKINDIEGKVIKIDSIALTIETKDNTYVIPAKKLISEVVEIVEA